MLRKRDFPEFLQSRLRFRTAALVMWAVLPLVFVFLAIASMILPKGTPSEIEDSMVWVILIPIFFSPIISLFGGALLWIEYSDGLAAPYSRLQATAGIEPAVITKMNEVELKGLAETTLRRLAEEVKAAETVHPGDEYNEDRIKAKREFEGAFNAMGQLLLIDAPRGYGQFFR